MQGTSGALPFQSSRANHSPHMSGERVTFLEEEESQVMRSPTPLSKNHIEKGGCPCWEQKRSFEVFVVWIVFVGQFCVSFKSHVHLLANQISTQKFLIVLLSDVLEVKI